MHQHTRTHTSRSVLALVLGLVLALGACGGDSSDDTTTTAAEPAAQPATTEAPATTQAETTTTTEATTTTAADPLAAIREAVEAGAGAYAGSWTNTTFGSTGPMDMDVSVEGDELVLAIDLGGFVFGQSDPDPETYRVPLASMAGAAAVDTAVFGPIQLAFGPGGESITLSAEAVPASGIAAFSADVSLSAPDSYEGTYVVTFDDGSTAEGVFEFAKS